MPLPTDASAPIILADGTKIDPVSGTVIKEKRAPRMIEVPSGTEAQAMVLRARKSIAELPAPPRQMNVISLVVFYTMYGLSVQDTALALELTIDQVKNIQKLEAYNQIFSQITRSILDYEASSVREFLQQKAMTAAEKIVELVEEDGALGLAAAKDVLDRAGHRPADVVEHKHSMAGTLHIEYLKKESISHLPVIDLSPEEYSHGHGS